MLDVLRIKIAEVILGRCLRAALYERGRYVGYTEGCHEGYEDGYHDGYREGNEEGEEYGFQVAQDTVGEWHKPPGY